MASPFDPLVDNLNLEALELFGRAVLLVPEDRPAFEITGIWDTSEETRQIEQGIAGLLSVPSHHKPHKNATVEIDSVAYRVSNDPKDDNGLMHLQLRRK